MRIYSRLYYSMSKLTWFPYWKKVFYVWNVRWGICSPNHMQLALKYILILFVICSRECHASRPHFSCAPEMQREKRLRSQTKEVVSNVYDYFEEVSRHQRTQEVLKRTTDATEVSCTSIKRLRKEKVDTGGGCGAAFSTPTKRYRVSTSLLVDDYSCLKSQKTIPDYYYF